MKLPSDLVPQKVVAEDLCVSLATLWRARKSGIAGFPAPVIIRSLIYWRKRDLQKLEDALMSYRGRIVFERQREATRKIAALKSSAKRVGVQRKRPAARKAPSQPNLFGD
jgi:hypothetical protein